VRRKRERDNKMSAAKAILLFVAILVPFVVPCKVIAAPNVVFLLTDDQRADTIAALGNSTIRTPNLDKLARDGFTFRNAYCMGSTQPAVCNPSRHMLLSGKSLYHYDSNQRNGTFADVMNKAGYVTWHVGKRSNTEREYHKAFQYSSYLQDEKERQSGHHGREAADRAIKFLKTDWNRQQPLFMYIAFEGPHDPRVAAEEWMNQYNEDDIPLPPNFKPFHTFNNGELLIRDERLAPWPRTPQAVRQHLHDYYGCITSLDHHIGRIIATFVELEEMEDTIFVFSSDHGLAIGSHGLFGKQNLYEHSMKSPLIFAGPGIPKGESDALVYLFDIFPTVLDLVGVKSPKQLDGKSLLPIMRGRESKVRESLFLAYRDCQRAVRQGDWKLIRYPQIGVTQLFNLKADPSELIDLADDPANAAKVQELTALLAKEQKHYSDNAPLTVEHLLRPEIDERFFSGGASGNEQK